MENKLVAGVLNKMMNNITYSKIKLGVFKIKTK